MSLETFVDAYIEAALWSSSGESDDPETSCEYLDAKFGFEDIADAARAKILADCRDFYTANEPVWSAVSSDEQAGHDFWLTRNGHGCGFWDRGYAESTSDALTAACRKFRECYLVVGDNGQIYVE